MVIYSQWNDFDDASLGQTIAIFTYENKLYENIEKFWTCT